ncbi:DUF6221 family protein [Streptomyces malaysiensis subsp. malaysiensis]|uniref:DUF6221 family protein n=1 Tax=Streptomyces malaysiensis TaxID=92644 RepID=UPI0024C0E4E7|nr:DUF6221 family protein [Streptomyces sp. NA07423]WHX19816.1 DUF6221 family protein [Streptomyces sp. NA07423]
MSDDLVAFLWARLDEDRTRAMAARAYDIEADEEDLAPRRIVVEPVYQDYVEHFTPARILAEIEAKRQILGRINTNAATAGTYEIHSDLLRLLVRPYADHPDYRDEWRL